MKTFAGFAQLTGRDPSRSSTFPVLVFYPTTVTPATMNLGPYTLEVSRGAPIAEARFPVVVFSHGTGSTPLVYRSIAMALANEGFVVAMPEHPGNNRNDNSLANSDTILASRPKHVSETIDAVSSSGVFGAAVDTSQVAVIGHSLGGYTALAVAGGQPWYGPDRKVDVEADARVKAIALLAPATPWYMPEDSLAEVKVPVLLLAAELDTATPEWMSQLVVDRLKDKSKLSFEIVPNAGHYSFLSPFPEAMKNPGFAPSIDPEGFDRVGFHEELNMKLVAFLRRSLCR